MSVVIPTELDVPDYRIAVPLDGETYVLGFRWSAREASWYMDVLTAEEVAIRLGIKVVPSWPLGRTCKDERFPPGAFMALDSSGADEPPGLHDLGARVTLVYVTSADLAAAGL